MILEELSKRRKDKDMNKSASQSKHKRADLYKNKSKEVQLREKKRLDSERRQSSRRADVQNSNRVSKGDSEPVTTQNRFNMFDGVTEEDAQKKDLGGQKSNIIKLPTADSCGLIHQLSNGIVVVLNQISMNSRF